jgi:hypothetical protein
MPFSLLFALFEIVHLLIMAQPPIDSLLPAHRLIQQTASLEVPLPQPMHFHQHYQSLDIQSTILLIFISSYDISKKDGGPVMMLSNMWQRCIHHSSS